MKKIIYIVIILFTISCKKDSPEPDNSVDNTTNNQTNTITEPTQLYIYSVTASPTDNESITLKNNSGASIDISGWTLGDENNSTAYSIPSNTTLAQGESKTFSHTTLGFAINDSGETIYLKNLNATVIDTWSN